MTPSPRFETVKRALERGERDCRLLDGRDFDAQYWRNAKRQLSVLRRDLAKAEARIAALEAVVDGGL